MADQTADVELMLQVKEGNRAAFNVLLQRHRMPLINFLYRFTGSRGESEDLAQEVFLKVYQAAGKYEPRAKFTTWLYRIATNVALNDLRNRRPQKISSLDAECDEEFQARRQWTDATPLAEESLIGRERVALIRRAISELPENQRLAVILTKYQELSLKEAGQILKCSETAVKSLLFRAYTTLRHRLVSTVETGIL
ncbi:MAG: sigma-70 family RNA polymerase sigma factor [Acidobacteriota bacterium]